MGEDAGGVLLTLIVVNYLFSMLIHALDTVLDRIDKIDFYLYWLNCYRYYLQWY